jgi:anti-sigma regulatory factor (Ser/Thr protein kinase)
VTEVRVDIRSEADVVTACQEGRALAERLGFSGSALVQVVTAISEVAGNIWRHAGRGEVLVAPAGEPPGAGIAIRARDDGPGIPDVEAAMGDGFSTDGGMGLGLPGARRLVDEFSIASEAGRGTTVTMVRWRAAPGGEPAPLVELGCEPGAGRAVAAPFAGGILLAAVAGAAPGADGERAAEAAAGLLERRAAGSPIALLEECHAALAGTRGAAIALASLHELDATLTWLAVGTAPPLLLRSGARRDFAVRLAPALRGSVGASLPPLQAATLPVMRGDVAILAAGPIDLSRDPAALGGRPAAALAAELSGGSPVVVARLLRGVRERRA